MLTAALTIATATLTGCSTPIEATRDTTSASQAKSTEKKDSPDSKKDTGQAKVGQAFTYEDGVKVTVVSAKTIKRSQYASGGKPGQPVIKVTVRIENGSQEKFDPALAQVNLRYGEEGDEADGVFQEGIESDFSGQIAPGRKATTTFGFAVTKGTKTFDVSVAPDWDHDEALFAGTL